MAAPRFDSLALAQKGATCIKKWKLGDLATAHLEVLVCSENGKLFVVLARVPDQFPDEDMIPAVYKEYIMPSFVWDKFLTFVPIVNANLAEVKAYIPQIIASATSDFSNLHWLEYNAKGDWSNRSEITLIKDKPYISFSTYWRPPNSLEFKPTKKNMLLSEHVWIKLQSLIPEIRETIDSVNPSESKLGM